MMRKFVNRDMRHQSFQRDVPARRPFIQNRPPEQKDCRGRVGIVHRPLGQGDALVKSGQIIGVLDLHLIQQIIRRPILHRQPDIGCQAREGRRKRGARRLGDLAQILDIGSDHAITRIP